MLRFIVSRAVISANAALICYIIVCISGYNTTVNVFAYATDTLISDPLLLLCIAGMTFILLKNTERSN